MIFFFFSFFQVLSYIIAVKQEFKWNKNMPAIFVDSVHQSTMYYTEVNKEFWGIW